MTWKYLALQTLEPLDAARVTMATFTGWFWTAEPERYRYRSESADPAASSQNRVGDYRSRCSEVLQEGPDLRARAALSSRSRHSGPEPILGPITGLISWVLQPGQTDESCWCTWSVQHRLWRLRSDRIFYLLQYQPGQSPDCDPVSWFWFQFPAAPPEIFWT